MRFDGPFIMGTGLVTALGDGVDETWRALLAGESIGAHSPAKMETDGRWPRVTQLALRAAREAIGQAGWTGDAVADDRTALLVGTSRGPINDWLSATPQAAIIGVHRVAADVAGELGMGFGPRLTFSAACASSLHALIRACMLLRAGEVDRAIVIGAEASLHPLFLACFQRLGVLARDGVGCRPFDVSREGFLVSEAAAAVCLEVAGRGAALARIGRCMMGSDAVTITSSEPSGAVIRRMLRQVIGDEAIDLIHAHGTGTLTNDPVELLAIEESCGMGDSRPIVYSHKAGLGHSLGASGLVSVVLNCRMHGIGVVPANVRTLSPLQTRNVRLASTALTAPIKRSLCIAAGFGGPVAVVGLDSV